jgi:sulfite reductase (NADPH) flavoprotein alpha-component
MMIQSSPNVLPKLQEKDLAEPHRNGAPAAAIKENGAARTHFRNEVSSLPEPGRKPSLHNRKNPFPARLLTNRKLNGPGSAKETRHFEISLADSGLIYEAGDALGVYPQNCPALVEQVIRALRATGREEVPAAGEELVPLRQALLESWALNKISQALLESTAQQAGADSLKQLLEDPEQRKQYLLGRDVLDLLEEFPTARFEPAEFVRLLSPLAARLYSISSSPSAHPDEAHLTVAVVRYESYRRARKGAASTFLAERVDEATPVPIFVQTSHGFRLPATADTPIIMVGPGTGIAPFRAFLEERECTGANGRNWLFFGDQRAETDFLYREELQAMRQRGTLTRLDTAFSRDQAAKIYVQHRMLEQAGELWRWIQNGAHFYVCGDAQRMAKDVDAALHQVIAQAGDRTADQAREYVREMKEQKRYQRDVY